ncbi:hypothetical protein ACFJGV_17145 [Cnuibacter sp. UC19_7]|uniref:hypothetical protein n=1 Tax=Cnuibacter sp. UC19_7 TaxID=3350166 RepID=UPI0036726B71
MKRSGALLLVLLLAAIGVMLPAAAASAVAMSGHAFGFIWRVDRTSWIGSYRLADGSPGFCLDVTKPSPLRSTFHYEDGAASGQWSTDELALLAYLSRVWTPTADPVVAAGAQLAIWRLTGLGGHGPDWYAQRANESGLNVLAMSDAILDETRREASRGASATLSLDLAGRRLTGDVLVDRVSSGPTPAPPGSHRGFAHLTGATFVGGSPDADLDNGVPLEIVPDPGVAVEEVTVSVGFLGLPYGTDVTVARSENGTQDLLMHNPRPLAVYASASASAPSPLPFQPVVTTATSEQTASAGASIHDDLHLDAGPGGLGVWGVYDDSGTMRPVPVVIESTLWGPLDARPEPVSAPPAGAPAACRVETVADAGPGRYRSPDCVLPSAGWYTWTASIDPARTPPERGGGRISPFASGWGDAVETSLALAPPTITTEASVDRIDGEGCVSDRLLVSGLPEGAPEVPITSTLIGPLPEAPRPGTVDAGWRTLPQAGSTVLTVTGNGRHETACIPVAGPGHYYFVLDSPGAPAAPDALPAFEDATVYKSESLVVTAPAAPAPPPVPLGGLPRTGGASGLDGPWGPMGAAALLAGLGLMLLAARRLRSSRSGRS